MVNAMNKVLRDCIPDITMPFLDDIPIKGCLVEEKDETIGPDGCRRFVATHIDDCERVLQRLENTRLTFSREKSVFGQSEIMVVGHLCGPYGRKPSPTKVEVISAMRHDYSSVTEVLGSMRVLPYLDPALRPRRRTVIRVAEEGV